MPHQPAQRHSSAPAAGQDAAATQRKSGGAKSGWAKGAWPVLVLIGLAALLLAAACSESDSGSGSNEETAGIIHRLLVAAGAENASQLESFAGELPEGLPVDPPLYPAAEIVVSSRSPASAGGSTPQAPGTPTALLYLIVLDTSSSREDVRGYYRTELDKSPWHVESQISTEQVDSFEFTNTEDGDIAGAISITQGGADGRTSILISLQDSGATVEDLPPYQPGPSLDVPEGFPEQIPEYSGATITGSAFYQDAGGDSYLVSFVTTDDQVNVIDFYTEELQQAGMTVTAEQPVGQESHIQFHDEARSIQGDISADAFARDPQYTEVRIQVLVSASPTPAPGATPAATPAP